MRISIEKDNPAYHPAAAGTKVYVNGEQVPFVFTADDVLGWVECAETDPVTGAIVTSFIDGSVIRKTVHGIVRIELSDQYKKATGLVA